MSPWTVGQVLEPLVKPTITREQLVEYAAASGDDNPIHLEDAVAKKAGFPSVIVHGMLSMAFMGDHLKSRFPEPSYRIARFKTRFRKVTFPEDRLECGGSVKRIGDDGLIHVALWIRNQRGETTTEGEADVVELSSA